jgi:hypothetical protein
MARMDKSNLTINKLVALTFETPELSKARLNLTVEKKTKESIWVGIFTPGDIEDATAQAAVYVSLTNEQASEFADKILEITEPGYDRYREV